MLSPEITGVGEDFLDDIDARERHTAEVEDHFLVVVVLEDIIEYEEDVSSILLELVSEDE